MVALVVNLLIWLEQQRYLPQSHVDVCGDYLLAGVLLASQPGFPRLQQPLGGCELSLSWVWTILIYSLLETLLDMDPKRGASS